MVKLLEGQQGISRVVVGGIDPSLPSQPLLKVNGFGTVGLGLLVVGHSGKNEVIEMAQCGSDCYCLFAAFYSDCELNTR